MSARPTSVTVIGDNSSALQVAAGAGAALCEPACFCRVAWQTVQLGYLRTSGMFIVMLGLRIIPWLTHLPRSHVEGLWMGGFGTLHSPSALLTPRPCLGSGLSRKPPFMRAGRCLLCAREPLIGSLQPRIQDRPQRRRLLCLLIVQYMCLRPICNLLRTRVKTPLTPQGTELVGSTYIISLTT